MGTQPGTPTSAVVGDVNGDARPDLVVGTTTGILLYLNDGSGDPFDAIPAILLGPATDDVSTLALGDLDGDSALDLVVGRSGATTIVYLGDGTGAFTPAAAAPALGSDARSIVIGNVKGSAFADVLAIEGTGTAITLFENNGTDDTTGDWLGVAIGATLTTTVGATALLAIGRINGDVHLDLFVASGASAEADGVLFGERRRHLRLGDPAGNDGKPRGRPRRRRRQRHPRPRARHEHGCQRGPQPGCGDLGRVRHGIRRPRERHVRGPHGRGPRR